MYWTIRFSLYSDCRHAIEARTIEHAPPVLSPLVELASSVRLLPRVKTPQSAYLLRWALQGGSPSFVFVAAGLTFGINICYDTAFPETAAPLARQGADPIVCPANNMMGYDKAEEHKELHNAERAKQCLETGMWLVSSDVTGAREGRISFGPTALAGARGATVVVPPAKTARVSRRRPRSRARDRTIATAKRIGRRRWKKTSRYHQQARVENTFFRYKTIIGDGLRARTPGGRAVEALLACNILNATMRATRRKGGPPRTTPRLGRFSSSVPTRRSRRRSRIHEHGTQLR